MQHLFLTLLLTAATSLAAQSDTTITSTAFPKSPVFVQFGLGIMPLIDLGTAELSAAIGYRFSPNFGLGVEYRSTYTSNVSIGTSAGMLGLRLRAQANNGILISASAGNVISAFKSNDSEPEFEYTDGGHGVAVDVGYQFRSGLTLGAFLTVMQNIEFQVYDWDDNFENFGPTDSFFTDEIFGFGLKAGFAFPRRGKRR